FEEFYSICDEREMKNFIDDLHDRKVKSKRVSWGVIFMRILAGPWRRLSPATKLRLLNAWSRK
ncbi:hypothetical protein O0536_25500, partial [Brevibacillus laterosporus]|uniref:hypothetical protein n=1 Tax=Brevibacillus laterosporus TaxID=1465 RepID=UPI0022A79928